MALALGTFKDKLTIRILKGPCFSEDRDKLKTVPGKTPIFGLEGEKDVFKHFEIPVSSLGEVLHKFKVVELVPTPEAKAILEDYLTKTQKINELEPIQELDFSHLPVIPKPYQEEYIRINKTKDKLICSMFMGAGKTISSLERARVLGGKKILIVCFKSPATQWVSEVKTLLKETPLHYTGTKAKRDKFKVDDFNVVVINYEQVAEFNKRSTTKFDQVIIDEAHCLSNPKTQRYKAVQKALKANLGAGIQLLTATPANHKLIDLWGPVSLIAPEIAGNYYAWKNRYERVVYTIKKRLSNGRVIEIPIKTIPQNLNELQSRLAPIMYRVRPEYSFEDITEIIPVALTAKQVDLYHRIKTEILVELENTSFRVDHALAQLTRLLQVSEGVFNLDPKCLDSGKLEHICHILDNTDEKVVVWSRFRPITEILWAKYKDRGVLYNGGVTDRNKTLAAWSFQGTTEVDEFKKLAKGDWPFDPGKAQFFFGTKSQRSSIGLNLHAARYQISSSFDWNFTVNSQCWGRLKRVNQEAEQVITHCLVSEGTIERQALEMVFANGKVVSQALDGKGDMAYRQLQDLLKQLRKA